MKALSISLRVLTFAILITALSAAAHAQSRSWVSALGDDFNPCSRTAPCKTFAGAMSKTSAGGEISVIDPGGYGTVTITKSVTIDGGTGSGWASILAGASTAGVVVNAQSSADVIRLRNLNINGQAAAANGILFMAGGTLHVENVHIFHVGGDGIDVSLSGVNAGRLNAKNVVISECLGSGVLVSGTNSLSDAVSLDDVNITRCGNGVRVNNRGTVAISNSVISFNNASASSVGVLADSAVVGGAIIDVENCQIEFNSIGIQSNANQAVRLSNAHITGNATALNPVGGGTIASYKNNRILGNGGGENFAVLTPVDQH